MSEGKLSPDGLYPVPDHHHGVVERRWDGEVWTDEVQPSPEGTKLAAYHRHFFGFLKNPGWKFLLLLVIAGGAAAGLWATDTDAHKVSGIQILMMPLSGIATLAVMLAFVYFLGRRVDFARIGTDHKRIIIWGIASGVVAFPVALGIELGLPKLFGSSLKDGGWAALAGPAEESAKILVPVILWLRGYFRKPIEGYLLVVISAATFGVMEGTEYGLSPDHWQPTRPIFEIMHPLFTGAIAAIGWQAAWRAGHFFTLPLLGGWLAAVCAHGVNDVLVLDHELADLSKLTSFVTIAAVVVMYLLQKHFARQLVPPKNVEVVSPRWRPVAPRKAEPAKS